MEIPRSHVDAALHRFNRCGDIELVYSLVGVLKERGAQWRGLTIEYHEDELTCTLPTELGNYIVSYENEHSVEKLCFFCTYVVDLCRVLNYRFA